MPAIGFGNTRILKLCAIDLEDASLIDFWDTETNASTYIARALATFNNRQKKYRLCSVQNSSVRRLVREINSLPISNDGFIKSMRSAEGVLCEAGFETPAETMLLFDGVKNKNACKSL